MSIISILIILALFIILTWIFIQDSNALYFGHDIHFANHLHNFSILPLQVSATEKGDLYIVWADNSNNNIYFSSSHNRGANFSQQVLLVSNKSSSSSLSSSPPQIAATEKGDVYVVWVQYDDIYFSSSNNSVDKFGNEVLLSNNKTTLLSSSPQIAATEKGDVYVVWVNKNNKSGDSNIEFISSYDSGTSFDTNKVIRAGKGLFFSPKLTATENGMVYAVWVSKDNKTGDSNIEFISSNDSGMSFNDRKKLSGGKPISFDPQISATEKGNVYVAWVDRNRKTDDTDLLFRGSNDSGTSFNDRERLTRGNSISSSLPRLTTTETGDAYIVWVDKNNKTGDTDLRFKSILENGTNFSRTVLLNRFEGNQSLSLAPQIASTNDGAYATWNDTNVQFKQILEDNVAGQKITLSNKSIESFSPLITSTQKGDIYAIWVDKGKAGEGSLTAKRISEHYFTRN